MHSKNLGFGIHLELPMWRLVFRVFSLAYGYPRIHVRIETDLGIEAARRRLRDEVRTPETLGEKMPPFLTGKGAGGPSRWHWQRPLEEEPEDNLMGVVEAREIRCWCRARDEEMYTRGPAELTTTLYPIFRGRLEETEEGTVLRGRFSPHRLALVFFVCLLVWMLGGALGMAIGLYHSGEVGTSGMLGLGVVLPLVALVVVRLIGRSSAGLATRESEQLHELLEELLDGDPERE